MTASENDSTFNLQPDSGYGAAQIQILEGLEAVRKRPAMYVGSTGSQGLHHLVYEIVDNAVDEALAGYCDAITVTLNSNGSVTVTDNGRGIPAGIQKKTGLSAIQVVFTILHAGGKFDNENYKVSGGLLGVGASVVNALSDWLTVQVDQDGCSYFQRYARGIPLGPLEILGSCSPDVHGTTVTFLPDASIFGDISFDYNTLKTRLRETAFLTKGLTITLTQADAYQADSSQTGPSQTPPSPAREARSHTFCYENGLKDFTAWLNQEAAVLFPEILYGISDDRTIQTEFSIQYTDCYRERLLAFVNNIATPDGGTHVTGFYTALCRAVNGYARSQKLLKETDPSLTRDELAEGLTAVISVKMTDPQFEGQTKQKLGSSQARPAVDSLVFHKVSVFLEQNPQAAKAICEKAQLARRAKNAAKSARDLARRKTALSGLTLPGKLADCSSRSPEESELFIVEGDSAGGSAKLARSREHQAVLPLRGKILNVEKATMDRILANAEIKAMISAFGTGVLEGFDLEKLRYHKIVLMTDADVDGAHITTLLLTFLFRFMPQLIREGHVYLAQPPLYRVEKGRKLWYAYSDEQLARVMDEAGRDGTCKIQRYKGLGEMDAVQLWDTTMDPEHRTLLKVTMDDAPLGCLASPETEQTFNILMGNDVEPRRDFIIANARYITRLDV